MSVKTVFRFFWCVDLCGRNLTDVSANTLFLIRSPSPAGPASRVSNNSNSSAALTTADCTHYRFTSRQEATAFLVGTGAVFLDAPAPAVQLQQQATAPGRGRTVPPESDLLFAEYTGGAVLFPALWGASIYQKLYTALLSKNCYACGKTPQTPIACLQCGNVFCCNMCPRTLGDEREFGWFHVRGYVGRGWRWWDL